MADERHPAPQCGPRYAVYFAPPRASDLWRFGCSVLGYDAASGDDVPFRADIPIDAATWHALTEEPRRYGFHATLTAPFHVRDHVQPSDVVEQAGRIAREHGAFDLGALHVVLMGTFVALVPVAAPPALARLAADCVRMIQPLCAPLSPADLARRLAAPLTPRQRQHLADYGYPYVFEDYRFHMTLSGRLDPVQAPDVAEGLRRSYAALAAPVTVGSIAVFRQPSRDARFQIIAQIDLSKST